MNRQPWSVLHFTNALARGGVEEHVLTLMRGLDRSCFRLHWVCPPEVADKIKPDLPADVELFPLCLRKPRQIGSALRLAQILWQRRVDIIHSHQFTASLFASPLGWLCRVPVIVETPHLREHWRHGWFKSRFVVDRLVGRFVDYYIAVSHANARHLVETKGLSASKIVVIQNGSDLTRFDPARPAPVALRKSLDFAEGDRVLLVVGRLEAQKGHRVLLDAMPLVRRRFPAVRLVCVGDGALRGELEAQAAALGVRESVRFVGYRSDVPDWLALADVVALPSFFEGLPLIAIEALAAGRPMVATAVDGTPEVIVDGKTGLTVPPGEPRLLAEALCRLLGDPGLGRALGRGGRRWVEEHFSQEGQVQRTQDFYLQAAAQSCRSRYNNIRTIAKETL